MTCGQLWLPGPELLRPASRKVAASSPDGKAAGASASGVRFPRKGSPPTPPSRVRRAASGRGQQREPVVLEAGWGGKRPPTSASSPSPPRLPPLRSEEGGDAEPSPGEEGASAARTPPPGRGSRRPEAGVSRKSSERGRTTGRTDTLSSSSERPHWETALQPPGPDRVGTLKRQEVEARPRGPEGAEVAEATFRAPRGGVVRGWYNEFRPRARARPVE